MRVSGPAVSELAARLVPAAVPLRPRLARHVAIFDEHGRQLDDGLALYFRAPHSATGEDVLELHLHGSPLIVELVMGALVRSGARLAGPGEFTRRAFINGKLGLHEAEAVADVIAAEHESALRAATAQLGGAIGAAVANACEILQRLLEELAGAIDFPDEVPDPERGDVKERLATALGIIDDLLRGGTHGRIVREGAAVAIVGPPNAGKSSLLNALLGEERVLVSPVAGTTRDTIEEAIDIGGVFIRLIDTAGIRAEADALEAAGIERTRAALAKARLAIVVVDGSLELTPQTREILAQTRKLERIVLFNKADLGATGYAERDAAERNALHGSIHDAATVRSVRHAVREQLVGTAARIDLERPALTRAREIDAANTARACLAVAVDTLAADEPLDLLAGDLLEAIAALGKITGATANEEMLDGIFSRFCIGK